MEFNFTFDVASKYFGSRSTFTVCADVRDGKKNLQLIGYPTPPYSQPVVFWLVSFSLSLGILMFLLVTNSSFLKKSYRLAGAAGRILPNHQTLRKRRQRRRVSHPFFKVQHQLFYWRIYHTSSSRTSPVFWTTIRPWLREPAEWDTKSPDNKARANSRAEI